MINLKICLLPILAQIILVVGKLPDEINMVPEFKQCLEEANLKIEDFWAGDKNGNEPQLCILKCTVEKMGILESDGTFNSNDIGKCPIYEKFSDDDKKTVKTCLEGIEKTKNCADMEIYLGCYKKVMKLN